MPSTRNIDLFPNNDVISRSEETDECEEIMHPRNSDLLPNFFQKKTFSLKGKTDILGKQALQLLLFFEYQIIKAF